jgi:hypothetical protein
MKTQEVVLRNKEGQILDNNEMVYMSSDIEKKYPIRRIVRWALVRTNSIMSTDCSGMDGDGDWGVDTFWSYFGEFYPELVDELSGDCEFEEILVDQFCL